MRNWTFCAQDSKVSASRGGNRRRAPEISIIGSIRTEREKFQERAMVTFLFVSGKGLKLKAPSDCSKLQHFCIVLFSLSPLLLLFFTGFEDSDRSYQIGRDSFSQWLYFLFFFFISTDTCSATAGKIKCEQPSNLRASLGLDASCVL